MTTTHSIARSMHDLGLATWFGGSLMGAVGVNQTSKEMRDPADALRAVNGAWGRWTPVNLAAIAAHTLGSLQLTRTNRARMAGQRGVGTAAAVKAGLTVAAAGVTFYGRLQGQKVMDAEGNGDGGDGEQATDVGAPEPRLEDVAAAQERLTWTQWAVPALTGGALVVNAVMGEQQRPQAVVRGMLARMAPTRLLRSS